jgi:hypothetical protein
MGEAVTAAIVAYLRSPPGYRGAGSLADLRPEDFGPGSETLSEDVDAVVYGAMS